jgi:hypothetical protein
MALQLWRDLAVVLLIVELMVVVLPFLLLFYFALKGILSVNRSARAFMPKVGQVMATLQVVTEKAGGSVAAPVIAICSYASFAKGLVKGTLSVVRGRSG